MSRKESIFHVCINGGPEQIFKTKTGLYGLAAASAVAQLDYEELPKEDEIIYGGFHGGVVEHERSQLVKIWVPDLAAPRTGPAYGPYYYGVTDSGHSFSISAKELPAKLR